MADHLMADHLTAMVDSLTTLLFVAEHTSEVGLGSCGRHLLRQDLLAGR
jgi:alkanesulfonate monooxygenase SsuD/methylene tetrahydromethanopterin reductase-like flavin-dependent oxidoreductase (luciferase family)